MSDLINREDAISAVTIAVLSDKDEIEALKEVKAVRVSGELISRADAIEAVCDGCVWYKTASCEEGKEEWECEEVNKIRHLPPAEAVQGWIPCSERLPDIKEHHVSDPCLVYCGNGVYGFAELEENIFGQVGWNCEREDEYHEPIGDVLAWMPLPTPYKGGDSE